MGANPKSAPQVSTRILAANFKLFYQNRGLWYWYLTIVLWMIVLLLPTRLTRIAVIYFISLMCGALSGSLQKEILTKPFTFLLPWQKKMPRQVIFLAGIIINILLDILLLRFQEPPISPTLISMVSVVFFGMALFLVAAWLALAARVRSLPSFIVLSTFAFLFICIYYGRAGETIIFRSPLLMIAVGTAISVRIWRSLANDSLARKWCGESYIGPGSKWNYMRLRKYWETSLMHGRAGERAPASIEMFLVEKMRSFPFSSRRLFVFGSLYEVLGKFPALRRSGIFLYMGFLVLFFLFISYTDAKIINVFYFVIILYPAFLDLHPLHNILFPLGRKERSSSIIVSGFVIAAVFTLLAAIAAIVSNLIIPIMPEIVWQNHIYQYHALNMNLLYLCPLFIPLAYIIAIQFPRIRYYILIMLLIETAFIWNEAFLIAPAIGVPALISLIALSWLSFVAYVKYYFRKRSLIFSR
jgi:hypothetical protein